MEDPTVYNNQKVAHRVEYRLNALLSRVSWLFQLFDPVNDLVEDFALENPKETADLTFQHRHRHGRHLVQRCETSKWARIQSEWVYPLRAKRFKPITVMIAIVTAVVAASVVTIFTAVELDRLNSRQQRADTVAKLGLMVSKKTNAILFTRKHIKLESLPHLRMYGQQVPNEKETKMLGVVIN
jgi:hypothetical protein